MKTLDLSHIKNCNKQRVRENYEKYRQHILYAEDRLANDDATSLREVAESLNLLHRYNEFYKAFKRYSSLDVNTVSNGKSNKSLRASRNRRKLSEQDLDSITSRYAKGENLASISKTYTVSAATIMNFMELHGIPRRTKSELINERKVRDPNYSDRMREYDIVRICTNELKECNGDYGKWIYRR